MFQGYVGKFLDSRIEGCLTPFVSFELGCADRDEQS